MNTKFKGYYFLEVDSRCLEYAYLKEQMIESHIKMIYLFGISKLMLSDLIANYTNEKSIVKSYQHERLYITLN